MEKLQKALEKARDQRSASDVAATIASSPQATSVAAIEHSWADLPSFEPDRDSLARNLLVSRSADQKATPFDILRTKTQLLMKKSGWLRLGITSPTPSCGKTTLACNLALGFTRQLDIRVVVIELDLRRPSMSKMLNFRPAHDVTDVLSGKTPFAEQAVRIGDNVALSVAQRQFGDPTSVLLSRSTHATLAEIEETYSPDLTIFDLPPVLVGDDTRAFLKEVDCALIIAKAEATSVSQIDACEREVAEQTNVLGVVLNQCRHISETDYGYEGYGEAR